MGKLNLAEAQLQYHGSDISKEKAAQEPGPKLCC